MPQRSSFFNFDSLFDTSPDAMIVADAGGHIVLANAQAARLFGYSIEQLGTLHVEALIPDRFRPGHERHRADYVADPRVRPMGIGQELAGLRADGTQFPVEIALSPIDTSDGRRFVASIRDISETQRARQALLRARYDALVARIGRLVLESSNSRGAFDDILKLIASEAGFDAVAIMLASSPHAAPVIRAASGWNAMLDDALPLLLRCSVSAATPSDATVVTARDLADDEARSAWQRLADAGSGDFALVPLFDRDQPMGALVAIAADAIDHERIHLLQSVAYLIASDAQRSRTEEQLAHSQRLDAVGQLTGGIAHDFNNLLTVISGNLQLLEPELADRPDNLEILASAMRAVSRGAELTRKLLAVARRQRLNPQAIAPRRLLDELIPMLSRTLGETVKVVVDAPADLPDVFVDPGELDTAILNLAINARDAMPRGGTLTIAVRERRVRAGEVADLAAGDYVVWSVRDTGLGMSPDVLARAFEPFFTTKESGRGSGLGLPMVYGFAKQSGGHLAADSRLGYGTRMDLYLPAVQVPHKAAARAVPVASSGGGETILVVEDETEVRRVAVAFLKSLGYKTHAAADAGEALRLLDEHADIALLFSDVILGGDMDGVELARAVRRRRPDLPTLLTSGYEHEALPVDDAETGPLRVLRKPYRREELAQAIRETLDKRG
jgi:PAS domain S-box-containing protein